MKLSEQLQYWRAERPDEWKMDEFIRMAERLEQSAREIEKSAITKAVSKCKSTERIDDVMTETIRPKTILDYAENL